ncbi:hypothetical protein MKZ38_005592 [Zalerion maritima]|uniref:Uncharacterized protein n=1 Tax=Zalerion maritima TaxID=339359 RepID=A0AAD5RKI8_9PEZI|nr:hypothetical protein MKZ38_005592 [Zalerion maritima]
MSSALSTYLVTGANRGVGKGIVSILLTKPSTTVIGAVRDPSAASVTALSSLPKATDSRLIIVKIDAAVESDPHSAVAILEKDHGISSIDVVVANAGICHTATPVLSSSTEALGEHFAINTAAPLHLLRAAAPLLKKSTSGRPTFVGISSFVGTISGLDLLADFPAVVAPYGASKAALNWLVRRLHFEEKWLLSLALFTLSKFIINSSVLLSNT